MQKLEVVSIMLFIENAYHVAPPTIRISVAQPNPVEEDWDYTGEYGQSPDAAFYWFVQAFPDSEVEELERAGAKLVKCDLIFNYGLGQRYNHVYIEGSYLQMYMENLGIKGVVGKTVYYPEWHVIL